MEEAPEDFKSNAVLGGTMESDERDSLQLKKIALEIAEMERAWWKRPAYILAALPTILAIIALSVGFINGFFSSQLTKLENQRHDLEAQVKEFEAKRDGLHRQNEDLVKQNQTLADDQLRLRAEMAEDRARLNILTRMITPGIKRKTLR